VPETECPWCGRTDKHNRRSCRMMALNRVYNADAEHQRRASRSANARRRGTARPDVYVKESGRHQHRVVAEQMLGRPLRPGEVVHHIDENKHNNDPSNLHVFASRREHTAHHAETPYERTPEHRVLMSARVKEARRG
jgi:HNH endonuclease